MRKISILLMAAMPLVVFTQTTFSSEDYCLVWSDEFDQDGLPNDDNWRYETGYSIRNNEAQNYTANRMENARVENGHLIIEAKKDNYQGHEISSASLVSWGKVVYQYGRFECRAKIDVRSGSWPAFWTLGESGEWPSNGEIDIMEYYQGKLLGNAAWGTETRWSGEWDSQSIPTSTFPDGWEDEFHIFMMEWTPNYIRLYVDDQLINEVDLSQTFNGSLGNYENPFRQPHYLILNQAIGGNNGGDYSNTTFPVRYEIDYVRIYQLGDCNLDCNWTEDGNAYLDECSLCVGGTTAKAPCELNCYGNLVTNDGFESGDLSSWTGWGDRWASVQAYDGENAVAVGYGAAEQLISVAPNTTYSLKVMARKSGGGAVFLGVKNHGAAEKTTRIDNNTWQEKELQFTTGNSTTALIYFYNPEGGTGYADDFYLTQRGCDRLVTSSGSELQSMSPLYPNPSSSHFFIDVNNHAEIVIFNAHGERVATYLGNNQQGYGAELPVGVYLVKISTEGTSKTYSWVKF